MKTIGWIAIGAVYLLTLITQLPHIYDVYSQLESADYSLFGISTALGAALAFEASVAIFTLRIIVNRQSERSQWTRWGIIAFLCVSAVANVSYYFDIAPLDDIIMPAILALALPLALWVYAEEFGKGAKAQTKDAKREKKIKPERHAVECSAAGCDWSGDYATALGAKNALTAHSRAHQNGREITERVSDGAGSEKKG